MKQLYLKKSTSASKQEVNLFLSFFYEKNNCIKKKEKKKKKFCIRKHCIFIRVPYLFR